MKRKPTNPITNIRTGSGDLGYTFFKQPSVSKNDPLIHFIGDLDEACAAFGRCEIGFDFGGNDEIELQNKMSDLITNTLEVFFMIGGMTHSDDAKKKHFQKLDTYVEDVERVMSAAVESGFLEPLNGFIIPNEENGDLMLARAVIRRAERSAVAAGQYDFVKVLNAMSDFTFLLTWYTSHFYEEWTGFTEV